jgi:hypothetical protein
VSLLLLPSPFCSPSSRRQLLGRDGATAAGRQVSDPLSLIKAVGDALDPVLVGVQGVQDVLYFNAAELELYGQLLRQVTTCCFPRFERSFLFPPSKQL